MKSQPSKPSRPRRARVHDKAGPISRLDAAEKSEPVSIVGWSAAFMEPTETPVWRDRQALITEAAFYLAEKRAFDPGHELEDWLEAERTVDGMSLREGGTI